MGRVLEITGTAENVKIADYVHAFVRKVIDMEWSCYNKPKHLNRCRKTDFALGIIEGLRSKLDVQAGRKTEGGNDHALVALEDPLLAKHVTHKYPRTAKVRGRALTRDQKVSQKGRMIGQAMVIHKGIEAQRSGERAFIEGA
jgi:hypothetical protein